MWRDVNVDVKEDVKEDKDEVVDAWYIVHSDLASGISGYQVDQEPESL